MWPGLKIAHKGIILVAVPLIFELFFLVALSVLLIRADAAIRREALSKQIIFSISNIQRKTTDCGTSAAIYKFTHSKVAKQRCLEAIDDTMKEFDLLQDMVQDDPQSLVLLNKARAAAHDGAAAIDRLLKTVDKDSAIKFVFAKKDSGLQEERRVIEDIGTNLSAFNQRQQDAAASSTAAELKARQAVAWALVAGVILNIFLAFWLAFYFSRNITGRISSVIENTRRIPKNLPLNPPISGADELAELDQVFHKTIEELRKSEEAKAYLIGMVSHDLRSPLTAVQAALTLLNEGVLGELPERAQHKLTTVEQDIGRVIRLSNDLLDVQRLSSGKLKLSYTSFPVSRLAQEAAETVRTMAEQHGVFLDLCMEDFELEADCDRLVQVLVNLLSNAIKFSATGGTVTLSCQEIEDKARFAVTDLGPGVAAEHQQSIFSKFVQVDSLAPSQGKGLGLSICKSLVELHEGKIGVVSNPGQGSTFWFAVPRQQPRNATPPMTDINNS